MKIQEKITKSVTSLMSGFVVEIERTGAEYTMKMTPLDSKQVLTKNQIYELSDNIKLLVEVASK